MVDSANAIEVSDLRKTYSDGIFGRRKFQALKGVTFSVPKGAVFGLLGPNGAGKTTFVKIMLGIVGKTVGDASVMGHSAGSSKARNQIGYLPEHLRVRRHHTAHSALEFYGGLSGLSVSEVRAKRDALLEKVGLEEWGNSPVKKFSKGMLQRLGLAQALLHDPDLLILDEPTDGLDPQARADVREIMTALQKEGKTIFLNSHILQEVEMVCDGVAILDHGDLKYCGPVEKIGDFIEKRSGIRTGVGMTFIVESDLEAMNQLVDHLPGDELSEKPGGVIEYYSTRIDSDFVNSVIDQLRQNAITIREVAKKHVTLEEAFLAILSNEKIGDDSNSELGETEGRKIG